MEFETKAVHAGRTPDPGTGALTVPLFQTSTFVFQDVGVTRGYDYSRTGNPTRKALETCLAALEGGHDGFACGTGMAAETTVLHMLKAGDHLISGDDVYGGSYRLLRTFEEQYGIAVTFLRLDSRKRLEAAIRPNTRMIWLETPSNPLLNIVDIDTVTDVARRHGILTVADNTFASPYFLRPIEHGVDLVVHSTTKYLNGHSDVVGGAVITTTPELSERTQFLLNALGTCASPFDCWLVLRGIKTLPVRMIRHQENAFAVAKFLLGQHRVARVYYPGLESHPGHAIAKRQMSGYGGVVSFELRGGGTAVAPFLRGLSLFALAESLGGADSLVEHPGTMSHASIPSDVRREIGIVDGLIRLSVGLEHHRDLIADLARGLECAAGPHPVQDTLRDSATT